MILKTKLAKFAQLSLYKNYESDEGKYGLLTWSIRSGYPRITVYTNNTRKKYQKENSGIDYNTIITATFNYIKILELLDVMSEIVNAKPGTSKSRDSLNVRWEDGVKTGEKYIQATTTVGKDKNEIIYIAVTEENKRKVKFELLPDEWGKQKDASGDYITKAEGSKRFAKAYIEILKVLFKSEMPDDLIQIVETEKEVPNIKKVSNNSKDDSDLDELLE